MMIIRLMVGQAYYHLGNHSTARQMLSRVPEDNKFADLHVEAYVSLAKICRDEQNIYEARQYLQAASESLDKCNERVPELRKKVQGLEQKLNSQP